MFKTSLLLIIFSFLSVGAFAQEDNSSLEEQMDRDTITESEGEELFKAYNEVFESVTHGQGEWEENRCTESYAETSSYPVYQDLQGESLNNTPMNYCHPSLIIPAATYFYNENRSARTRFWRNLKGPDGLWRGKDFYPNQIKRELSDYSLNMTLRSGEQMKIDLPRNIGEEFIRVDVTTKEGGQMQCLYPFSDELLQMNQATQIRWNQLNEEQRGAWVDFCAEYVEYEETALEFEENDWTMDVDDHQGRPTQKTYDRCPAGLEWKKSAAKALCGEDGKGGYPLLNPAYIDMFPNLKIPSSFVYFFDGYGDFNAERAKAFSQAANVNGREPGDLVMGYKNANGLRFYENTIGGDYTGEDVQFLYYDGTEQKSSHGSRAAAHCHEDMNKWLEAITGVIPHINPPKKVAMGFSNGGAAALSFQKQISRSGFLGIRKKQEAQLDLLVTIDPISRPVSFAINKATGWNLLADRRETTTRHINFYQDSDYGSFGSLRLTSSEVNGADENFHLSPEDMGREDGRYAHLNILRTFSVQDRVRCEFDNLIFQQSGMCP